MADSPGSSPWRNRNKEKSSLEVTAKSRRTVDIMSMVTSRHRWFKGIHVITTAGSLFSMAHILGLDFGTKRVGAAISDPGRTMAFPLEVYELRGPEPDARHYRELVLENDVERIVVGLPLHTSGRESELALRARTFGTWLASVTALRVDYYDERYSTIEAERHLNDARVTSKKRKALRDKLAAQIMLQGYLDAGCPDVAAAPGPLSDQGDAPS
jgi:putative holliday junction resolvase